MSAMSMRLWEITDELETVGGLIAENGGELTPEIEARLDALEGAYEAKVERIALAVQQYLANAGAAKVEEERLAAIRRSHERSADGLKRYLLASMRRSGNLKVETPRARVRVQKNGQPSITWTGEPDAIPEHYRRVTVAPDLSRVRDDIKAGLEPPEGFVVDIGYHVRIA